MTVLNVLGPKSTNTNVVADDATLISMENEVLTDALSLEEDYRSFDEVSNIHASLESLIETADAVKGDDGLSIQAASIMDDATSSLTTRLGFEGETVTSMESFGTSSDRIDATNISLENMKERAKDIGKWIMEQINKLRNAVRKFWLKVKTLSVGLQKSLEAKVPVLKKIGAVEFKTTDIEGTFKAMATDGKINDASGAKNLVDTVGKLAEELPKYVKAQVDIIDKAADNLDKDGTLDEVVDQLSSVKLPFKPGVTPLIGNMNLFVASPEARKKAGLKATISAPAISLNKVTPPSKVPTETIKTDGGDVAAIVEVLIDLLKTVDKMESTYFENKKLVEVPKALKDFDAEKSTASGAVGRHKELSEAMISIVNINNRIATQIGSHATRVARTINAYAAHVISAGKKGDDKKDDKKED